MDHRQYATLAPPPLRDCQPTNTYDVLPITSHQLMSLFVPPITDEVLTSNVFAIDEASSPGSVNISPVLCDNNSPNVHLYQKSLSDCTTVSTPDISAEVKRCHSTPSSLITCEHNRTDTMVINSSDKSKVTISEVNSSNLSSEAGILDSNRVSRHRLLLNKSVDFSYRAV